MENIDETVGMDQIKVKHTINNPYNQNVGFLFLIAICSFLIFSSLDMSIGAVILQPYYAYPALISVVCLPIVWLVMASYWRLIHPIIAVVGGVLAIFITLANLVWMIVWGYRISPVSIIPMNQLLNGLVLLTIVILVVCLIVNIKKYHINSIIMSAVALLFVLIAPLYLIPTASDSFHTEVTDSVIVGRHRYIVTRHRSHVDVENPAQVTLYQCNTLGFFCNELHQSHIWGYPSSYLIVDDTIKLEDERHKTIYEYHPEN